MTLEEYTDEQILMELIRRNGRDESPSRVAFNGEWFRTDISIGEDCGATVYFQSEDFYSLSDITRDD